MKASRVNRRGIPWLAAGSVLGTGLAAGAALFMFAGLAADAGDTALSLKLPNPSADGCTALALDRDRRQTEAAPCADAAAEVAASGTLSPARGTY